jgi:hypothetical protein
VKHVRRIRIALTSIFFLTVAVAFWIDPVRTAATFGLAAANGQGLVSVCADFGGLFLGLGTLTAFGAVTLRRGALLAAATMLASIALGRVIGWIAHAGLPIGQRELMIEAGTAVALLLLARSTPRRTRSTAVRPEGSS